MNVREYIKKLEFLACEHGDNVEVELEKAQGRESANDPKIDYRRILKGRETTQRFFLGDESRKGEKVVRLY